METINVERKKTISIGSVGLQCMRINLWDNTSFSALR